METMYLRYVGYCQDRDPLASMAYFRLTVLLRPNGKKRVAERYGIDFAVLDSIGRLSSKRGAQQVRKASGRGSDLKSQERRFLEEAIRAVIYRAAEKDHNPDSDPR